MLEVVGDRRFEAPAEDYAAEDLGLFDRWRWADCLVVSWLSFCGDERRPIPSDAAI